MDNKNIQKKPSDAVIKRLPRYFRQLTVLKNDGVKKISSKKLSEKLGLTASQVRQDLNCFGGFGQQGYGYNVEKLLEEIGNILGVNNDYQAIVIGAGNMGKALANYKNFNNRGFTINGLFDANEALAGARVGELEVLSLKDLPGFIKENRVDLAIITVPTAAANEVARQLYDYGIRAFWNFSATALPEMEGVVVENVHLSDSLMTLGYKMNLLKGL